MWKLTLCLLLGCAVADEPATGTSRQLVGAAITPSSSALARPERVHVLPVLYIPAATDVTDPAIYSKALNNLRVELLTAQAKYAVMLKRPGAPAQAPYRGTFSLATWDITGNTARVHDGSTQLEPLVINSPNPYPAWSGAADLDVMAEVMTKTRCKAQSCPFIFIVVIASGVPDQETYGRPINYGYGGSGFVRMSISRVAKATSNGFQSTLLHELGHAIGLKHTTAYNPPGVSHLPPTDCQDRTPSSGDDVSKCTIAMYDPYCDAMLPELERYAFHCSPSIMSYDKRNRVECIDDVTPWSYCELPTAEQVEDMAGTLIAENEYNLARAELVLPEFAADFDLVMDDDDGDAKVLEHEGYNFPEMLAEQIPGHRVFRMISADSEVGSMARMAIGHHANAIRPLSAAYDPLHMWRSIDDPFSTFPIKPDYSLIAMFPEPVDLRRVRAFTGHSGGLEVGEWMRVYKSDGTSWHECGHADFFDRADAEALVSVTGACAAPASSYRFAFGSEHSNDPIERVTVRGLRMFTTAGVELMGPREPVGTTPYDHPSTWKTPIRNVVGSDQQIAAYSAAWNPATMWHSMEVDPYHWVWIDIRLPYPVRVSLLAVYTGHSGLHNAAQQIIVERRGATGAYSTVASVSPSLPSQLVGIPGGGLDTTHLRIHLRTDANGHITVRGIRLFTADGEIFTPRSDAEELLPLE